MTWCASSRERLPGSSTATGSRGARWCLRSPFARAYAPSSLELLDDQPPVALEQSRGEQATAHLLHLGQLHHQLLEALLVQPRRQQPGGRAVLTDAEAAQDARALARELVGRGLDPHLLGELGHQPAIDRPIEQRLEVRVAQRDVAGGPRSVRVPGGVMEPREPLEAGDGVAGLLVDVAIAHDARRRRGPGRVEPAPTSVARP